MTMWGVGIIEPFWGRGCLTGSAIVRTFERAMVGLLTIALSLSIRPQFAIECFRRSNQQRGVTLGQNLGRKGLTVDRCNRA